MSIRAIKERLKFKMPENGKITLSSNEFTHYANYLLEVEERKIRNHLKKYDKEMTFKSAMYCKGCVQELFNVLTTIDLEDYKALLTIPFTNVERLSRALGNVNIDRRQITRIAKSVLQMGAVLDAFSKEDVLGFYGTMGEIFEYVATRRPYFDAVPNIVLKYCKGNEKISINDAFCVITPVIDLFLIPMVSTYMTKVVCSVLENAEVELTFKDGKCVYVQSNAEINTLDPMYLIPLRWSLDVYIDKFGEKLNCKNTHINLKSKDRENAVYSYNEYLDFLVQVEIMYEDYVKTIYSGPFKKFIDFFRSFKIDPISSPYSVIEYWKLRELLRHFFGQNFEIVEKDLISEGSRAIDSVYSIKPFIKFNDYCYTTIISLTRFVALVVEREAQKSKKYQIQTGYDFEKSVRKLLISNGFIVREEKRIDGREFDVIAEKDGKIYNFQCKNYYLDPLPHPAKLEEFVYNHKRVIMSLKKALEEEKDKEVILKSKYSKPVVSVLLSRYPVFSTNSRIISYRNLEKWLSSKEYLKIY